MDQPALDLVIAPQSRRRGRPPGRKNKRSADLARYVEATYGGMTPGQQAAELAMIKPAEVARAKQLAVYFGILEPNIPPLMLAMAVKARQLAKAIGCSATEAWILLAKERAELMPFIHQRQAQASESKARPPATVFLIPEGEAAPMLPSDEGFDFIDQLPEPEDQVG